MFLDRCGHTRAAHKVRGDPLPVQAVLGGEVGEEPERLSPRRACSRSRTVVLDEPVGEVDGDVVGGDRVNASTSRSAHCSRTRA